MTIDDQLRHEIDQCRPLLDWLSLEEATRLRGYLECTTAQRMAAAGAMVPARESPCAACLRILDGCATCEHAHDVRRECEHDAPRARDTLPSAAPMEICDLKPEH